MKKEKVLFINACVRPMSRTYKLAQYFLDELECQVDQVNLYEKNVKPIDFEGLKEREDAVKNGKLEKEILEYAIQFANADIILIAAPFWDLSFPAILKIYIEQINVSGITFKYSEEGIPNGLCKAKKLIYITTSGGYIGENDFGFMYIKELANKFWGIQNVEMISAEGLDILVNDVETILNVTKEKFKNIIK